jgi:hypothetical protein
MKMLISNNEFTTKEKAFLLQNQIFPHQIDSKTYFLTFPTHRRIYKVYDSEVLISKVLAIKYRTNQKKKYKLKLVKKIREILVSEYYNSNCISFNLTGELISTIVDTSL